jgi:ribosomal protein S19E (S16A)
VKDVPSHDFVRAYAAHLKRSGKVSVTCPSPRR